LVSATAMPEARIRELMNHALQSLMLHSQLKNLLANRNGPVASGHIFGSACCARFEGEDKAGCPAPGKSSVDACVP